MSAPSTPSRDVLRRPFARLGLGLVGATLLVPVAYAAFFLGIGWFLVSDPPDVWDEGALFAAARSWGAVAKEISVATGLVAVAASVGALAAALMSWALRTRWPSNRWVAIVVVVIVGGYGVTAAARQAWHADRAVLPPTCSTFSLGGSALAGGGAHAVRQIEQRTAGSKRALIGIARCDVLDGKDVATVRAALGPPLARVPRTGAPRRLNYDRLELSFENGRVVRSELDLALD